MISFFRGHGLSPDQRQAFFISIGAFFTAVLLLAMVSIVLLIVARGGGYFWPQPIYQVVFERSDGSGSVQVFGQNQSHFEEDGEPVRWLQYSAADAPFGRQALLNDKQLLQIELAEQAARISLHDGRQMLARPVALTSPGHPELPVSAFTRQMQQVKKIEATIAELRDAQLADIHRQLTELDRRNVSAKAPARQRLNRAFNHWHQKVVKLEQQRSEYVLTVAFAQGENYTLPLNQIYRLSYPGQLSLVDKLAVAGSRIWRFLSESPKQANTAGGVFPALFGTVLMVFLMTIIVTPFGVLAAVYLNEYAPDNGLTAMLRVCVANMAGVPSIVYGVFGLGFFIYGVGGSIDALFFEDTLPAPTMGTPGVFWAALTMAVLTLPVVIVATEEGLRNVPENLKAGSYALGATKAETVWRTILPMASPGIMTGVILAIARAAGEVAPLMLVGAVKFAPNLPVDSEFPFLHLDRQFMHLGVLIYDGAFHSQTDAKSASMMFAACLLLLVVVFVLNILAVILRARLRRRYQQR